VDEESAPQADSAKTATTNATAGLNLI
jgi:hypothetical protein